MNLLVKVTHIFRLIQVCQQTVPILHHQIFLLALWLFSTVIRHRGISKDHRGKTVYDVASGDALFISELGPLPENVTWLSPEGEFQKWNGTAWVKDAEAEKLFRIREAEETKNSLMQVASEHIAPLQDAVDLEIATEEETSLLEAWKKYRVLLNRVNTTTAPDIEWPTVPIIE